MNVGELLKDKGLKAKEKTEVLSQYLLDGTIALDDLLAAAANAKDPDKGTCIEALEFATRQRKDFATLACLQFVSQSLTSKGPRVKWESAKVIGNIAAQFPDALDLAIPKLLANTEDSGTVVRWSAAFALGEIILLKLPRYADLPATAEAICAREEKGSIQKIYRAALKKAGKQ